MQYEITVQVTWLVDRTAICMLVNERVCYWSQQGSALEIAK